jgi:hypothetical protein
MNCQRFAITTGHGSIQFLTTDDALTDRTDDPRIRVFASYGDGLDWITAHRRTSRVLCAMSPLVITYPLTETIPA